MIHRFQQDPEQIRIKTEIKLADNNQNKKKKRKLGLDAKCLRLNVTK